MPQYKVVELREGLIGGKMSGDKLERVLNGYGSQGRSLKAITSVDVKGGHLREALNLPRHAAGTPPGRSRTHVPVPH